MNLLSNIFIFIMKNKKYWVLPLIFLLIFGIITIMYDENSILAPFIYRIL